MYSLKTNPRQIHQLDIIAQFSTDIRHVQGIHNIPTNILLRIKAVTQENTEELGKAQKDDEDLSKFIDGGRYIFSKLPIIFQ